MTAAYAETQGAHVDGHAAIERARAALRRLDAHYARSGSMTYGTYSGMRDGLSYAIASVGEALALCTPPEVERATEALERQVEHFQRLVGKS